MCAPSTSTSIRRAPATTSSSPTAAPAPSALIRGLRLPMLGQHNVQNSLAAIAVAHEMGADDDMIRKALAGFGGVKRRFTRTGEVDGITVIDDYGHHPVEIAAVLRAARAATTRQGHRRRAAAPLHAPRQSVRGILHLLQRCRPGDRRRCLCRRRGADRGHQPRRAGRRADRPRPSPCAGAAERRPISPPWSMALAAPGDLVVCLGAGTITQWAHALPDELADCCARARRQGRRR